MRLGETLLPWKSKDKKCCLYETPYVAASIWVLGDVIAKFYAPCMTSYRCTYKSQIFFGSRVTHFWRDTSHHFKTPMWNFYKEVYKQKWYQKGLHIALLEESREEYLQASLQADSPLMRRNEQNNSGTSKIKMTTRKGCWAIRPTQARHTHCAFRQVGTTANQRYDVPQDWLWDACQMARVHWETHWKMDFVARKVHTIKLNEVQGTNWKANKCKEHLGSHPEAVVRQATINLDSWLLKSRGDSLPKLYCIDLVEAYVTQESDSLRIVCEKKRYDLGSPNGRLHEKPSAKGGTGK